MRKMIFSVVALSAVVAFLWTIFSSPKAASCASLAPELTPALRKADAALVKQKSTQHVTPDSISMVLEQAPWRLVWATPNDAERGVFFFKQSENNGYQLVDIWGGVLAPEDRDGAVDWASKLNGGGPSPQLIRCFVDALAGGK